MYAQAVDVQREGHRGGLWVVLIVWIIGAGVPAAAQRKYLDLTDGWNTVIGCPGCFDTPAPSPAQAAAAR